MKKLCIPLLCVLLLMGCGARTGREINEETTTPVATVPPDGNPEDVTCQGSYTGLPEPETIVGHMDQLQLTAQELQVWYWSEVAQYCQSHAEAMPDFDQPLDTQPCPIDDTVASWQQYFLKAALNRWHTTQALIRHAQETPLPTEDAYRADPKKLETYMTGMPATRLLYGYDRSYRPNSQHQSWLDALPETLLTLAEDIDCQDIDTMAQKAFASSQDAVLRSVRDLNYGYMYFTTLSYGLESQTDVIPDGADPQVTFRQILLLPEADEAASGCTERAVSLLSSWAKTRTPTAATFAQLASQNSQDPGSAPFGGLYRRVRREQLSRELAPWCFDPSRQEGDTTVIPAEHGTYILYFLSRENSSGIAAQAQADQQSQQALLQQLRERYPAQFDYGAIALAEAQGLISVSDLLYPDVAHQRFPEVPLYLQQDYPGTMYGEYKITTNGCGITSLAMIASYLTDDELTPPEMCARYGRYSRPTGTAGSLFEDAPPQLGFYLIKKTYDWREARTYMQEGHPVVVCQYRGYWTRGGHYLVLETLTEDGLVQVRDSNIYNYSKLPRHKEDKFPWDTISTAGQGYWIYEKKATVTAACTRCGDPDALEIPIVTDYLCEKCQTALLRRESYLSVS